MQWELLVTPGHVRAARLRNALPAMLGASIAALILAMVLVRSLPESQPSNRIAEAKAAYVIAARKAVDDFLQGRMADLAAAPGNITAAPTPYAMTANLTRILETLNQTGALPDNVVVEEPDPFWRGQWRANTVHAVETDRTIIVGAYVDTAQPVPGYDALPKLRRGFWIIRRPEASWVWRDNAPFGWVAHCLALPGALTCGDDVIYPTAIPQTMRGLLPVAAFETQP